MKKIDDNVVNKYAKIIRENDLSTNSAYPQIEIIREIDNIKNLRNNINDNEEQDSDLSEIQDDELNSLYINMDFLGLNLAQVPTKSSDWKAYIIPVLYVVVSIISMRITNPTKKQEKPEENEDEKSLAKTEDDFDPMAQMNKNMNMMFPIMYVAVALVAPLGLALYWLMNSLLMIIERLVLNKLLKDEEEE